MAARVKEPCFSVMDGSLSGSTDPGGTLRAMYSLKQQLTTYRMRNVKRNTQSILREQDMRLLMV